jgi:formyl-CoA transferase
MPVAPGQNLSDVLADPQHKARAYFVEVHHPCVGDVKLPRLPFISTVNSTWEARAPLLGEHTFEVLTEWLGLTSAELQALRETEELWTGSREVRE